MAQRSTSSIAPQDSLRALIRKKRIALELSQDDMAYLTGYARSHLNMIENGKRNPSLNTIFAICSVLRIRPSAMLRPVEKDAGFEFISETQLARELLSRPRVSKFGKKKPVKTKR